MISARRSCGLKVSAGVVEKPFGVEDDYDAHAIIDVPDPKRFCLILERLEVTNEDGDPLSNPTFCVRLVPPDRALDKGDVEGWGFMINDDGLAVLEGHAWTEDKYRDGHILHGKGPFEFCRIGTELYVAIASEPRVKVAEVPPTGNYLPCISVLDSGCRVRVSHTTPAVKRRREQEASAVLASLWSKRAFADASVVCGTTTIPVHRCVLVSASPFFEKVFEGNMREAKEASVRIQDASSEVVLALLEYLYTGSYPSDADASQLLQLAHRFECRDLAEECASGMLRNLSKDNVGKVVASLRPFAAEPHLLTYWKEIAQRIRADEELVLAHMNFTS